MAEPCGDDLAGRITVIVTTSPIPSHPAPALIRALFASLREHLPGMELCPRLLVCDGYRRDDGKGQLCPEPAYEEFLQSLDGLVASGELGRCSVMRLATCHGYGLALEAALRRVETEFVLVVQHDWLFVRQVDASAVLAAFAADGDVKYVGMQSMTTLDYARRMKLRYNLDLPASKELAGLSLVPQLLWYDKPHFCRTSHYLEEVIKEARMGLRECPERRYGVDFMWPRLLAAADLSQEHRRFGTFFVDVGAEVTYHLSGRKLRAGGEAEGDGAATVAQLEGTASLTATYTAVAVERKAHVAGLSMPEKQHQQQAARFKGRCFICGEKGHSKLCCPQRTEMRPVAPARELLAGC